MEGKNESGQALVLILLSLSVVLTLVLYILSRSVTDVAVSSTQEQSVRAFSAAEAGIERSLVVGGTGFASPQTIGNASYTTAVTDFALGTPDVNFPSPVSVGDTATVWFVSHALDGSLTCSTGPCFHGSQIKVCWGNPGTAAGAATTPAVEVSVYYETTPGTLSTINIGRDAIDPNVSRRSTNSFSAPDAVVDCTVGTQKYQFQKTITFASLGIPIGSYNVDNGLQLAKIRLLYNSDYPHLVGASVSGGNNLPSQGQRIDSSGTAGGSNRRIVVYQGWGESPFSSNSLMVPAGITQ